MLIDSPEYQMSHKEGGIALLELLIALMLFAVCVVGLSQMQMRSVVESLDNHQRSFALWQGKGLIDRISANNSADALAEYRTQIARLSTCTAAPVKQCEATTFSPNAVQCDVEEMAGSDVWNTFCADGSGLSNALVNYTAELNCSGLCGPGSDMSLRISWISKSNDSDSELREATVTIDGTATDANLDFISLDFRS